MNIENFKQYWFPIEFVKNVNSIPIHKKLLGVDLVIFKTKNGWFCFEDNCPHRNVPLSLGNIVNNKIKCKYHGWEFNEKAELIKIPGKEICNIDCKLKKFFIKEEDGILWINLNNDRNFINKFNNIEGFERKTVNQIINGDFLHNIENFLDPNHTPYIHKGILRNENFQEMKISQISNNKSFETNYELLNKQNGLFHKLFDYKINMHKGKFELPGFASLEYLSNDKMIFRIDIFFVPVDKGIVSLFTNIYLKKDFVPMFIKFFIIKVLLKKLFQQDKEILEIQYKHNNNKEYLSTEADLVIDHLLYLIKGKEKGINKDFILKL